MPAGGEVPDDLLEVEHRDRVDARERLVEEDEPRREREGARDLEAPPLAARERVRDGVREVRELEAVEEAVRRLLALRAAAGERLEDGEKVLDAPSCGGRSTAPAEGTRGRGGPAGTSGAS